MTTFIDKEIVHLCVQLENLVGIRTNNKLSLELIAIIDQLTKYNTDLWHTLRHNRITSSTKLNQVANKIINDPKFDSQFISDAMKHGLRYEHLCHIYIEAMFKSVVFYKPGLILHLTIPIFAATPDLLMIEAGKNKGVCELKSVYKVFFSKPTPNNEIEFKEFILKHNYMSTKSCAKSLLFVPHTVNNTSLKPTDWCYGTSIAEANWSNCIVTVHTYDAETEFKVSKPQCSYTVNSITINFKHQYLKQVLHQAFVLRSISKEIETLYLFLLFCYDNVLVETDTGELFYKPAMIVEIKIPYSTITDAMFNEYQSVYLSKLFNQ